MKHSSIIFLIVCLALVALVSGCNEEKTTLAEKRLVVEGWIDSGEFPVVKLTRTMPLGVDHKVDIDKLSDYVERWAKVTISDGERSEVMVGRYDKNYFPPFVYTSYEMRGEVGKTYTITVETDNGERATAQTTIPEPMQLRDVCSKPADGGDGYLIYGYTDERKKCKLFVKNYWEDKEFQSMSMGLYDSDMYTDEGKVTVKNSLTAWTEEYTPYFKKGDTVIVKVAALDDKSYDFWRSYEDMSMLSRLPMVPMMSNLKSNVHGALGYWCGYGVSVYMVVVGQ